MTHVLYCLTSPIGKKYYGITENFSRRMREHERAALAGSNLLLPRAIRKYGWREFKKELVCEGARSAILQLEISAILTDDTFGRGGYNLTPGGDGGVVPAALGGKKASRLGLGVHRAEVRSAAGKRAKELGRGVHGATSKQLSEWSKLSMVKWTSEQARSLARRCYVCHVCGLKANAGNMKQHQMSKGHTGNHLETGNLP